MATKGKNHIATLLAVTLVAVIFGTLVPAMSAQCAYVNQQEPPQMLRPQPTWGGNAVLRPASLALNAVKESDDMSIVGFWKVKFVSEGSTGIPDGTVVDIGLAEWHSDGTEIMNSGMRAPATGNYCLGVWKKTGGSTYGLNHFAISFDPSGQMIGPANIREAVTVNHGGGSFAGTFTIDQYDVSGQVLLAHVQGTITGIRITVDTTVQDIF